MKAQGENVGRNVSPDFKLTAGLSKFKENINPVKKIYNKFRYLLKLHNLLMFCIHMVFVVGKVEAYIADFTFSNTMYISVVNCQISSITENFYHI